MAHPHGTSAWHIRMAHPHGTSAWHIRMAHPHGTSAWHIRMAQLSSSMQWARSSDVFHSFKFPPDQSGKAPETITKHDRKQVDYADIRRAYGL